MADDDLFGAASSWLGDLNGDGVGDLVVSAVGDDPGGASASGAFYVLFMNADGTVNRSRRIGHQQGGGPNLAEFDFFGRGIAAIGDLNDDGVTDLAVGAPGDDTGGDTRGAVYTIFLSPPPTVTLDVDNAAIAEDGGIATVTAALSTAVAQDVIVDPGIHWSSHWRWH